MRTGRPTTCFPLAVVLLLASTTFGQSACQDGWITHYSEDFESYSHDDAFTDSRWTGNVKNIVASDGTDSIKYMGNYADSSGETMTLTFDDLPPHDLVQVFFSVITSGDVETSERVTMIVDRDQDYVYGTANGRMDARYRIFGRDGSYPTCLQDETAPSYILGCAQSVNSAEEAGGYETVWAGSGSTNCDYCDNLGEEWRTSLSHSNMQAIPHNSTELELRWSSSDLNTGERWGLDSVRVCVRPPDDPVIRNGGSLFTVQNIDFAETSFPYDRTLDGWTNLRDPNSLGSVALTNGGVAKAAIGFSFPYACWETEHIWVNYEGIMSFWPMRFGDTNGGDFDNYPPWTFAFAWMEVGVNNNDASTTYAVRQNVAEDQFYILARDIDASSITSGSDEMDYGITLHKDGTIDITFFSTTLSGFDWPHVRQYFKGSYVFEQEVAQDLRPQPPDETTWRWTPNFDCSSALAGDDTTIDDGANTSGSEEDPSGLSVFVAIFGTLAVAAVVAFGAVTVMKSSSDASNKSAEVEKGKKRKGATKGATKVKKSTGQGAATPISSSTKLLNGARKGSNSPVKRVEKSPTKGRGSPEKRDKSPAKRIGSGASPMKKRKPSAGRAGDGARRPSKSRPGTKSNAIPAPPSDPAPPMPQHSRPYTEQLGDGDVRAALDQLAEHEAAERRKEG